MCRCLMMNWSCSYAYKNGCRCDTCVRAHRDRCYKTRTQASFRAAPRKHPDDCAFPDNKPYTGYQYGCRCPRCRAGQAKSTKKARARMRKAANARKR